MQHTLLRRPMGDTYSDSDYKVEFLRKKKTYKGNHFIRAHTEDINSVPWSVLVLLLLGLE